MLLQDEQYQRLDELKKQRLEELKKLEERIEALEGKVSFLENSLVLQNRHVHDLEQYGRRLSLRIYGLPVVQKETANDVLIKVKKVVSKLGVKIPDSGFDRAHRVGRIHEVDKGNKRQAIIVRMNSWTDRTKVYRARMVCQ